ncbi:MAG: PorT family protein [Flavobacteriales bacterium]|nr:PorT family protein [Flavobacteriales bacterium]
MGDKGKIFFGITAGYNLNKFYGKEISYIFNNSHTNWLSGFHVGLHVETRLNPFLSFLHEIMYTRRGAGVSIADTLASSYVSRLRTEYVDCFPFNIAFGFRGFRVYAGPYLSGLLSASLLRKDPAGRSYWDKTIFGTPDNFETHDKYLQKLDYGVNAGLTYFSPFGVFVQARYMHGICDIFQYANSYTLADSKTDKIRIFHQNILVSIGYRIPSKK